VIGLSEARLRTVLAWAVVLLTSGPVGGAVVLGVAYGESPCILCWSQRTSMALMALTGIFVLRYGPRPRYVGTVVLLGVYGLYMALRHSALHLARDVGQGFAASFFGAHTYIWAFVIHWVVLAVLAVLLLLLREDTMESGPRELRPLGRFAVGLFMVVVGANALQAFITTGPPPFMGQADPLRFSAFVEVDADPDGGPLVDPTPLPIGRWEDVTAPLHGRLTDLAYDARTGRFLAVTDRHGVYVLDSSMSQVEYGVTLDSHFAVDLTPLAGAAFMGDTLAAVSTNKSYVLLRGDPEADEDFEWRHFLTTSGGVSELRRSRLATLRAKQMYILSAAYDPDADELVTVSVPSPRHQRMVISRFDRSDLILSSEFLPHIAPSLALAGPDRSLAEYVVTGAVVADGMLYAVSAAYSAVLVVDLAAQALVAAYAVQGIEQPVGIALRGEEWLIAQADGRVAVVTRPGATR
jgi:disulfide bond formation protein DsbB